MGDWVGNNTWKITEDDYTTGLQNGISRELVYKRVYHGKTVLDAVTTPPRASKRKGEGMWSRWKDKSEVPKTTFYDNLRKGMSPEDACKKSEKLGYWKKNEPIPQWVYDKGAEIGLSKATVYRRINDSNWSWERACTTPIIPPNERKKGIKGGWK